ncbi:MAG: IS1380 family transposase, partial [Actinophytocola sp.]|nr:IS1380 family transposase [Actinophytocola sp.]
MFEAALDQLEDLPDDVRLVVRADTAGCTHDFLAYLRAAGVGFSVGYAIGEAVGTTIRALDEAAWLPALTPDGEVRDGAAVVEITDQLTLAQWPAGARVLVRREPLHPGAQQTLDDIDGYRFTAFLTDQPDGDIVVLEQRHRAHARVEDRIRGAKDTGARNLPCDTFARNAVWLQLVLAA